MLLWSSEGCDSSSQDQGRNDCIATSRGFSCQHGRGHRMTISRRDFIAGVGGAVLSPAVARAQPSGGAARIGVLTNVVESDQDEQGRLAALSDELRRRGWIEGTSIHFDYRWTAGEGELVRKFAAELVGMKPDVIFVAGTTTVSAVLQQTRSIPVVFVTGADPVKVGFVESLARPGRNATGF